MKVANSRSLWVALLVSVGGAAGWAQAETAGQSTELNIPAQSLRDALADFGRQTGLQVIYQATEVTDGLTAPSVVGEFSAEEALARILSQSGLVFEYLDARTVAVRAMKPAQQAEASAAQQPGMRMAQADVAASEQVPSQTSAAPQGQAEPTEANGYEMLDEVLVTAQKRKERLQDVPVTVSVISSEQIARQGLTDVKDLLGRVPGLTTGSVERNMSRFSIRGIASDVAAPTVAIFLDDLPVTTPDNGFAGGFDAVFFDLDRVEVLKGPQGTLYGGSAMGGAIKYVSARPNLSKMSVDTAAGVATTRSGDLSYNAEAVLNLPLVEDRLALRGGLSYRREGGFIDNITDGEIENTAKSSQPFPTYVPATSPSLSTYEDEDYNDNDTLIGRLSLLWQLDPTLTVRPALLYQEYRQGSSSTLFPNMGDLNSTYRRSQPTRDDAVYYSLDIIKTFGSVELTSLTSYFDRHTLWHRDYSFFVGGLVPPFFPYMSEALYDTKAEILNQEIRIASAPDSGSRLKWVLGAFYSERDLTLDRPAYLYAPEELLSAIFPASLFPGGVVSPTVARSGGLEQFDQKALFSELTYSLTDAFDVTAGARYFEFDQRSNTYADGPFNGGLRDTSLPATKETGVNPKLGVSYKVSSDNLLFVSATKGFRPGGATGAARTLVTSLPACVANLNRIGLSDVPESYESDNLWTYELGTKNQLRDRALRFNASAFYTDWKKIQQSVNLPDCGQSFIANAGSARVTGAELETDLRISSRLQLGGSAIYADAKITDSAFGGVAEEGDTILDTPEWMASFYASYSIPVSEQWSVDLRADYNYRSKARQQYVETQSVAYADGGSGLIPYGALFRSGYDQTNVSAILGGGATSVRLYVSNVFDERPLIGLDHGFGSTRSGTLRPRTIGVEFRRGF